MGATSSMPYEGKSPLREFSVVYTDRATNLMSQPFRVAMKSILDTLKEAYNGTNAAIVPGSGTFAMESVARQFGHGKKVLVLRNGYFAFRWSQIFDAGKFIKGEALIAKAIPSNLTETATWQPCPLERVVELIHKEKPDVVFAPHVETSTGIILPQEYIQAVGTAVKSIDGLFVLDCIASGALWVDMKASNVDILISAPQKGWSGPACCGFVVLGDRALSRLPQTSSSSYALDLKVWFEVADQYQAGNFKYHTTLPTDALMLIAKSMAETKAYGFERARERQKELGRRIREVLTNRGLLSVAGPGYEAPGVVVVHAPVADFVSRFQDTGVQIAGQVPFKLDEHEKTQTFRVGLFGLDKLTWVDETVGLFEKSLSTAMESRVPL